MSTTPKFIAAGVVLLSLTVIPVPAAVITFTGADLGVLPASPSGPNSTAAAASFDTAATLLGTASIINFESAPVGPYTSLLVAPGVTLTGSDIEGVIRLLKIRSTRAFLPGRIHDVWRIAIRRNEWWKPGFHLTTPVQFFGAPFYLVSGDFVQDTYTFSDGSSETIDVPEGGTSNSIGELVFVGFTDAGKSITSVTINAGTSGFDAIGVDDVRYQSAASTAAPEPASAAMLLTGVFGLTLWSRRRGWKLRRVESPR